MRVRAALRRLRHSRFDKITAHQPRAMAETDLLAESCGMTSDVEDPEAFDAVFPQASSLVAQHELLPLVHELQAMLAQPSQLFAALLPPRDSVFDVQSLAVLKVKVGAYEHKRFDARGIHCDRLVAVVQDRLGPQEDDGWSDARMLGDVDTLMMRLALYYMRLWRYVTSIAVGIVHFVETTVVQAHQHWVRDVAPLLRTQISSSAAAARAFESKGVETLVRPLRLRPALSGTSKAQTRAGKRSSGATAAASSASRRARLARESNEFMVAWFLAHKANPYPSPTERSQIAARTGLTEQQVRNWFANMRKRHWKPKSSSTKKPRCLLDVLLRQQDA
ncbi:hypothetical protein ATCC90586_007417 [Pythium insidiosum]|nr:hypothetical protein ATCC90586_007417 [Pythium insidiosum]